MIPDPTYVCMIINYVHNADKYRLLKDARMNEKLKAARATLTKLKRKSKRMQGTIRKQHRTIEKYKQKQTDRSSPGPRLMCREDRYNAG